MSAPPRISLALAIHNHQPVGNFGWVFEETYERSYAPFVDLLERHPGIRVSLHYTGPLLQWLLREHPTFVERVRALVGRGQVELLGGGFYEPVLATLHERDRISQLRRMGDELAGLTGHRPQGAWLAERVWEPSLPTSLVDAGYGWTIVDDVHLRSAGVPDDEHWAAYTTDDQGRRLTVFGTEQGLRYLIPFRPVAEVIEHLRAHATAEGDRLGMMGDDGEKFGGWPTTYEHCWGRGRWMDEFVEALEANADWLTTVTPSAWLAEHAPVDRVYLPTSSYTEMTEWVLPPAEAIAFGAALHEARDAGRPEARFLRGGFWRNFQRRYREINDLHKQMLRASDVVDAMAEGRAKARALDHLLQGQSNDCYWHGLFGGIYITHMRLATLEHLIAAEDAADRAAGRGGERTGTLRDTDLDGTEEALFAAPGQVVTVKLDEGAGIGEWDIRAARHALTGVMRRRPEASHERLRAAEAAASSTGTGGGAEVESIHEIATSKEPGLSGLLFYDAYERRSGLLHLLEPTVSPEAFIEGLFDQVAPALDGPYRLAALRDDRLEAACEAPSPTEGSPSENRSGSAAAASTRGSPWTSAWRTDPGGGCAPASGSNGASCSWAAAATRRRTTWWTVSARRTTPPGGRPAWARSRAATSTSASGSRPSSAARATPGGRPSTRSPTRRPDSSGSTREARCCSAGSSTCRLVRSWSAACCSACRSCATTPPWRRARDGAPTPEALVHAHFYQPSRLDPFTGQVPREPGAAPFHDWNERIAAECYRPNAERGNLDKISFDLGPTLASWLAQADPETHARFVAADAAGDAGDGGNAMAQAYHHAILPLASLRDRRTEIRWGIREFELRFGRPPTGLWLPETAVDVPTLRLLAEQGITHTILAPWQSADADVETRRPYRLSLGGGRSIVIVYFDGALSAAVSFDANATVDAEAFARQLLGPRLAEPMGVGQPASSARRGARAEIPTVVIASDGEFYGHHQKFRDLFLQRLIGARGSPVPADYDVVNLATFVADEPESGFPPTHVSERTSWSCHHGVLRWTGECPDATDGRWKGPLRQALDRLAAGIDQVTERLLPDGLSAEAFWAARDGYVDVLQGALEPAAFLERHLDGRAPAAARARVQDLFEAQRWRLAMFASDGWFWDDPSRLETQQILRAAARAVRIVDGYAGTSLERRLGDDLCLFTSPARRIDGYELYREALADVGQAMP